MRGIKNADDQVYDPEASTAPDTLDASEPHTQPEIAE
jgi:hypothetical protein